MKKLSILVLFYPIILFGQIRLPLAAQTPPQGTSNIEMINYLKKVVAESDLFDMEIGGTTHENREIPVVYFPRHNQGKNRNITVMVFAQQHGNEPSGKEALLMLIHELYLNPNKYDFDNLNLILIPMSNPDGNEAHKRRNGKNYDLNRNHVILTEPETQMLHRIFEKYKPEVTLDVHEYGYRTWLKKGFIKDFGEQFDCISNPAIAREIKKFAIDEILNPTISKTRERKVKANRYLITRGDFDYFVRHSTTDINDGRNGFGIQQTLSFIVEGFNPLIKQERIWQRAKFQLTLIESFLQCCNEKSSQIKKLVWGVRKELEKNPVDSVVIVSNYSRKYSRPLEVILTRTSDFRDTTIVLKDYRPEPEALMTIKTPQGYIIDKPTEQMIKLIQNHFFNYKIISSKKSFFVEQFNISGRDTLNYESRVTILPSGFYKPVNKIFPPGSIFIPAANVRANQIVQIFEPQSFYGLSHYEEYKYLIESKIFPIYRVIETSK